MFFIHLSIDEHLVCFYILGVSFQISVLFCFVLFLDIHPGAELLNHMVVLVSVLGGSSILFSIVSVPICIATNSGNGLSGLSIMFH